MKKENKKTDKKIVRALSNVCDTLTAELEGFRWLTHFVDYANVSQSLRIVIVFDTDLALADAVRAGLNETVSGLVKEQLEKSGILISNSEKALLFDSEERGADIDSVQWCRKHTS